MAKSRNPDVGTNANEEPEDDDFSRTPNRALAPGESVYHPPDGSPAYILRPGEKPPEPQAKLSPVPPPPMYDGKPWTPPVQPWEAAVAASIRCTVPGCGKRRARGTHSTLCKRHRKIKERYGDVHAVRIPKTRITHYLVLATRFMGKKTPRNPYGHREDANVVEAVAVMEGLLWVNDQEPPSQFNPSRNGKERGATSSIYLLWKELRRLKKPPMVMDRKGMPRGEFSRKPDPRGPVTGEEALTHAIAWYMLTVVEPEHFGSDITDDVRRTVLGRAVLHLRQRATNGRNYIPVNGAAMRLMGKSLTQEEVGLGRFLEMTVTTIQGDERTKADRRAVLLKPTTLAVTTRREEKEEPPPPPRTVRQEPAQDGPQQPSSPVLTEEQAREAKRPWSQEDRRAFEAFCRSVGRTPDSYTARQQTNWIRKRRGLPLLPDDPPPAGFRRDDFLNR